MNPLSYFYTLRSYVDSYAGLLGRRFLSIIWVAAISVVIWFYGYLLAIGDFKPLASVNARLVAVGLVLVAWAAYLAYSFYQSRKRDAELVDDLAKDAGADAAASQQAEVAEIHGRLKEALALLRRVTRKRFGYIYELPWYVIFGAAGSGKTTALTNSGLKFPLGDALGSNSIQGVGGTRNCNWWFADEAIIIDTAGRYTTQDDLNGASKAGWEGFLNLMRKYRRAQPVNGVLVTLSIADLKIRDHEAQMEEIRAVRQRLSELDGLLGARVPVYVVLTKVDLLTGFVDFFDGFSKTDREQVWGMTFGLEESYQAASLPDRFLEEFALLQERVDAMLIERLQQEPDAESRGRIFRFPAELAALKDRLHEVLQELCSGSKLVEPPLLRGLYLASGTQTYEKPVASRLKRSYFLSRLFREVIFAEASLVMRDRRLSRRQLLLRRAAYGAAAAVLVVVLGSWAATYWRNLDALSDAERRLNAYEELARGVSVRDVSDADFLRILPALDELRNVPSGFAQAGFWPVSFGLDQESKLSGRHRDAYQRALTALLLPRMLVQLQKEIKAGGTTLRTFNALKLYGMLGGLGPLDPEFVSRQSEDMFAAAYPGEGRAPARQALLEHVAVMAAGTLPPIDLDERLIAEAREKIGAQGLANRAYDILTDYRQARALDGWNAADALGPLGEQVFTRSSRAPLRQGISGLFTANGYRTVVLPRVTDAAREALDEQWVRGGAVSPAPQTVDGVAEAALQLYFDAFRKQWASLLSDIRVRPSQTPAEATETARILASDANPVEAAARSIAAATDLRMPTGAELASAAAGSNGAVTAALASTANAPDPYVGLRAALAPPQNAGAASGEKEPPRSQVQSLRPLLQILHGQLSRASTASAEIAQVFDAGSQLTSANQDLLQAARGLPAPLDAWMAGVAVDVASLAVKTARARTDDLWAAEGASLCSGIVSGRYPFDRNSARDVPMGDFVRLFGPEGLFKTFFKERLEAFVDTSSSPWGWRGTFGAETIPSPGIAEFEKADKIRQAFFPASATEASISIQIKPLSLSQSSNAVMMEIGGERVVYYHGPIQAKSISWPSSHGSNVSRVAFQPGSWQQATTESGDWSAFRLFDRAELTQEGGDLFRARFENHGQVAEFEVQFGSVLNPFRLPALADFSCPVQF
ncbi:type VI secretion system membrane subunit TssM [Sinorhizobium americanum]|uniref:IcmF-related protein n=1 Tax=Sinorhizobium americanum TaxID=194963 RepID=A0A1L3LZV1_9HYPH|nr:type VI secretion system membrane subunit TssM [Sinorhizobium americanum]APG95620.1 IcmF-related protein [Sinorhizobium americanum]OAP46094.1 type VI secretion protein IcmF [Sinorhizobium americanum]